MSTSIADSLEGEGRFERRTEALLVSAHNRLTPAKTGIKRALDVALAMGTLAAASPLIALIALLVKTTTRGPVLFKQERVGRGGVPFTVFKFRTMRDGTHAEVLACERERIRYAANDFKLPPDDPRITRVGRHLRLSSLDELPQLLNVIRGEMSMVGIRPLLVEELALRSDVDRELYRLMRPGLTGAWQVGGRSTVGSVDRHQLDRDYVAGWSLLRDLEILVRTPFAVLRKRGAH